MAAQKKAVKKSGGGFNPFGFVAPVVGLGALGAGAVFLLSDDEEDSPPSPPPAAPPAAPPPDMPTGDEGLTFSEDVAVCHRQPNRGPYCVTL